MDTMRRLFVVLGFLMIVGFLGVELARENNTTRISDAGTGYNVSGFSKDMAVKPETQSIPVTPKVTGTGGGYVSVPEIPAPECSGHWKEVPTNLPHGFEPGKNKNGVDHTLVKNPTGGLFRISFTGSYDLKSWTDEGDYYFSSMTPDGKLFKVPGHNNEAWGATGDRTTRSQTTNIVGITLVKIADDQEYTVCGNVCGLQSPGTKNILVNNNANITPLPEVVKTKNPSASRQDANGVLPVKVEICVP